MTSGRQQVERRKQKRFRVPRGIFVLINPDSSKVGQIIDIGMDGLAFDYVGADMESSTESRELKIFTSDYSFRLYNIPCRIVSDLKTYRVPPGLPTGLGRCGVHFGDMTPYQTARLEYFIGRHTMGEK
jgi:hypothetical protein